VGGGILPCGRSFIRRSPYKGVLQPAHIITNRKSQHCLINDSDLNRVQNSSVGIQGPKLWFFMYGIAG
jgi:hypothetical protein